MSFVLTMVVVVIAIIVIIFIMTTLFGVENSMLALKFPKELAIFLCHYSLLHESGHL